jgi:tetratricopeptide (TPR) repeat protein
VTARTPQGPPRASLAAIAGIVLCVAGAMNLQIARDRVYAGQSRETARILYVQSGEAVKRLALDFDALWADVYWIRAIQHYGGERLHDVGRRNYELLFPLVDLTTTLDPYFSIAYRFGAIFLSEAPPGGPGRPDQAIALLRKGVAAQPGKWQYPHDIAFVYYWHFRDFDTAAMWFQRAAELRDAPNWLKPLAASVLGAGSDRASARFLWNQILQSEEEWLRRNAARALSQLDAVDAVDQLQTIVNRFPPPAGGQYSWDDLVRRRVLRGIPLDPVGTPFELDPATGRVSLSRSSSLSPLPQHLQTPPS